MYFEWDDIYKKCSLIEVNPQRGGGLNVYNLEGGRFSEGALVENTQFRV